MIYNGNVKEIKEAVRLAAMEKHMRVKDIAAACGLSPQNYNSRFLRKDLSLDTLREICAAIGCDIDINIIPRADD